MKDREGKIVGWINLCKLAVVHKWLPLLSHFSRVQLCVTSQTAAHQAPPSLGFSRQEHWSGLPFCNVWKWRRSVVSDSQRLHRLQPSRLLHPLDFPGKSTGVGCHCLLQLLTVTLLIFYFIRLLSLRVYNQASNKRNSDLKQLIKYLVLYMINNYNSVTLGMGKEKKRTISWITIG